MPRKTVERISKRLESYLRHVGAVERASSKFQERLFVKTVTVVDQSHIRKELMHAAKMEGCRVVLYDQHDERADHAMIFREANVLTSVTITNYSALALKQLFVTFEATHIRRSVKTLPA